MKTTLIIMAAGIGSRFGTGIKQLAKMSPNGEIIMDYSIYDAKEAGFDKVVFIIRKDISIVRLLPLSIDFSVLKPPRSISSPISTEPALLSSS